MTIDLSQFNSDGEQWTTTKPLYEAMKRAGCRWYTYHAMLRHERKGLLTLPKNPDGTRRVTETMIREIVRAFSPGGAGEWHFDER